ncbi:hypothetical protein [Psychroserpens algicola]|uniref:Lipoprotein n=1 Tax=Psychroserpens algicola TaxID=1719034 RepID=A0ABT0HBF1_9FLAO|nr:hypothetical protein [Psychroserpens algicola]MCK8481694.1 hypothetical protein [Psychroserpens algicola]
MSIFKTNKALIIVGIFTILVYQKCYTQMTTIEQDSIEIEFVKNNKLKNKYPKTYIGTILNGFRITVLEVNVKTLDLKKGKFDPNKFYLVSEKPEFQYRPLDIFITENNNDYSRFELVTKKKPEPSSKMQETYNPNIKDTYLNYKIDGVSGIIIPINLGSSKFPDKHVFHFKPKVINDSKILIYFYISSDFIKRGTLYYGNEEIAKTDLK